MKKYRVKLNDERVIGPFFKEQVAELYQKGHITGKEQCQVFPGGEWRSLYAFHELAEEIKRVIASRLNAPSTATIPDSTILVELKQFKTGQESSSANLSGQSMSDIHSDHEFREFRFDINKIKASRNEELKSENLTEDEQASFDVEKTVVRPKNLKIKNDELDKTFVKPLKEAIFQQIRNPDEADVTLPEVPMNGPVQSDQDKTQSVAVQDIGMNVEAEMDFEATPSPGANDGTVCIDTEILEKAKKEAAEFENQITPSVISDSEASPKEEGGNDPEASGGSGEDKEIEGNESKTRTQIIVDNIKKNKKRIKPLTAILFVVIIWFFLFDDDDKALKEQFPINVPNFSFPITKPQTDNVLAKQLYEKGVEAYKKGDYLSKLKALQFFHDSLEYKFDDNLSLGFMLLVSAELLKHSSNLERDGDAVFKLVQLAKLKALSDVNITMGMGIFFGEMNRFAAGIQAVEHYIRINQPTPRLLSVYLDLCLKSGDIAKARQAFDKLLPLKDKPIEIDISLVQFMYLNEEYDKIGPYLEQSLKKHMKSVPLYLLYAKYAVYKKDFSKLANILKVVSALEVEHALGYYAQYLEYLGTLAVSQNKFEVGAKYFRLSLALKESEGLRNQLASLEVGGGKNTNYLISESKMLDFMKKSKFALKDQDYNQAIFYAMEAADVAPYSIAAKIFLAKIQTQQGYFDKATQTLIDLQKKYPQNKVVNFALVDAYIKSYKFSDAHALLQAIGSTKLSTSWEYASALGRLYEKSNNYLQAILWLQRSIERNPLNDSDFYLLSATYMKYRKYDKVKSLISRAIDLDPANIDYKSFYAKILYELDTPDTAVGFLRDALITYPDNPKLLGDVAIYYYKSGQLKSYEETKKRIASLERRDRNLYEFLLNEAYMEENRQEILANANELLKIDPGNLQVKMELAQYLMQEQEYDHAKKVLDEIEEKASSYPKLLYSRSKLYFFKGDLKKALEMAQEEINRNPHLDYGYILIGDIFMAQDKLNEASMNYGKALALTPRSAEALKGLAMVKYKQNQYDAALDLYLQASKISPNDAIIKRQLGFLYKDLGQRTLALEAFRVYLELNPDAKDRGPIQKIMDMLK